VPWQVVYMPTHEARIDAAPQDPIGRGAYFRELARQYRQLASTAESEWALRTFEDFAKNYDDLADEAEAEAKSPSRH
jgi:hypothetical protein